MKRLMILIPALLIAGAAFGQQYKVTTFTLTNAVAATATNSTIAAAPFTCTKYSTVDVQIRCNLTAAGTAASQFKFARSVDGTTYETTPFQSVTLTSAGTTTTQGNYSFSVGSAGYIRLASAGDGDDDGVLTNIVVQYSTKPMP